MTCMSVTIRVTAKVYHVRYISRNIKTPPSMDLFFWLITDLTSQNIFTVKCPKSFLGDNKELPAMGFCRSLHCCIAASSK